MIIGVGLDVVELARMEKLLSGAGRDRFLDRVLTEREKEIYATLKPRRALEFASGRFAAKEAIVKAIGCGIGSQVGFRDVEVLPDPHGKPVCGLSDASLKRLGWVGLAYRLHLAITHERSIAAATAIIEKV
ncbi:holo-ACP synthase [Cohnella suwonensis]|uniref:Holo-[acyl-carrier-protein] synthase n=1 Tax=Cohnella suwonensis TaxID=696072 RepID=A0ABW0M1U2_9BACL